MDSSFFVYSTPHKWEVVLLIRKDRDIWCTGHMYTRYVQTGVIYHFRHYYPFSGVYFPKERILQLILSTEIEEKFRFNEMLRLILTFQKSMVHCNVSWNTNSWFRISHLLIKIFLFQEYCIQIWHRSKIKQTGITHKLRNTYH